MVSTAALSLFRYMTTVMLEPVTPCQVEPPLSPPAQRAMHPLCSCNPVTQNGEPAVLPLAGSARPGTDPVLVPAPTAPGPDCAEPVLGPLAPGAPGSAPGDADDPGVTPEN